MSKILIQHNTLLNTKKKVTLPTAINSQASLEHWAFQFNKGAAPHITYYIGKGE